MFISVINDKSVSEILLLGDFDISSPFIYLDTLYGTYGLRIRKLLGIYQVQIFLMINS